MTITRGTSLSAKTVGAQTSVVVDITSATVGNWVYAFVICKTTGATITTTGWNVVITKVSQSLTQAEVVVRRQKQVGDTTFTFTVSSTNAFEVLWQEYAGLDPTTPDEGGTGQLDGTAGNSMPTPAATPTFTDRWAVGFFAGINGDNTHQPVTWTTAGMTQQIADENVSGSAPYSAGAIFDTGAAVAQTSQSYTGVISNAGGTAINNGYGGLLFLVPALVTTGSGAVALTATASVSLQFPSTGSATVSLVATATDALQFPVTVAGALALTATATDVLKFATTATGALALAATAADVLKFATTGAGAITLAGSAATSAGAATTGTGAVALVATATASLAFATSGTGGLTLTASAASPLSTTGTASLTLIAQAVAVQGVFLFTPPSTEYSYETSERLWMFFRSARHGQSVIRWLDGTFSLVETVTTDEYDEAAFVYLGGHIWTVSDDEAAALTAAGYGAGISSGDPAPPYDPPPVSGGGGGGGGSSDSGGFGTSGFGSSGFGE